MASEVTDITSQVSRVPNPQARSFGITRNPFIFNFWPTDRADGPDAVMGWIQGLLNEYGESGARRRFSVLRDHDSFHVVPSEGSILTTRLSISDTVASGQQLIEALVDALSRNQSVRVVIGTTQNGPLRESTVHFSAQQEPAGDVLTRILALTGRKYAWRLLYDYGQRFYALNLPLVDPGGCVAVGGKLQCDPGDAVPPGSAVRGNGQQQ